MVTFWVMSQFFHFLGASRDCADFRDPTAVFRIIVPVAPADEGAEQGGHLGPSWSQSGQLEPVKFQWAS